jgi:signal transduction histidine kinase
LLLRLAILDVVGLLLLGFFLGRKLFDPLGALRHGIEQVADGHWKEIPLNKPPMQNSGDEIESVALSFNRMVRELSSAQTRLIDVQKELAKKDKMAALGRFSAGIAHEINNPLGTILVTASMLKEAAAAGKQVPPEDFDAILDEVRRCRDIIATLRTYTGRTQPQLIKMNFSELMRQISDFLENEASFKDLLINISLPDQPDRKVLADIKAMYQVFNNLVKNSAEAMSDMPEKRLNLIAEIMSDHFIIKIQDYGRGFECLPEHIFEPLFTTKPQGTGLGLIICQAIIDGHHGRIEATRLENSITEFSIMLPFAEPDTLSKEEK